MHITRYILAASLALGLWSTATAQEAETPLPPGMERYEKGVSKTIYYSSSDPRTRRGRDYAVEGDDIQALFMQMGVRFPPGSSITYNAVSSKLIVTNTPEQLRVIQRILSEIIKQPSQISIHVSIIRVPNATVSDWGLDGLPPAKPDQSPFKGPVPTYLTAANAAILMAGLRQVEGFEVVTSNAVMTMSGQTANSRIVERLRLVEEHTEPEVVTDEDGNPDTTKPTVPIYGEEQRFGGQLTVTPTVGEDETTIDLELNPTYTDVLGWDTSTVVVDGVVTEMRIPIVLEYSVETRVLVKKGDYVLLNAARRQPPAMAGLKDSGRVTAPEKDGAIFFILTADVVPLGDASDIPLEMIRLR